MATSPWRQRLETTRGFHEFTWPRVSSELEDNFTRDRVLERQQPVETWDQRVQDTVLATGVAHRASFVPLQRAWPWAVASDLTQGGRFEVPHLGLLSMLNQLQCLGLGPRDAGAVAAVVDLLWGLDTAGTMPVWRHHSRGLAAIALDLPGVYRPVCGYAPDQALPFTAGEVFGLHAQGLLTHLGGAVEVRATEASVLPAFWDAIENWVLLTGGDIFTTTDLMWLARIVHHTIGGAPLESVAEWLHDSLWEHTAPG